jgi:hypothetical protein
MTDLFLLRIKPAGVLHTKEEDLLAPPLPEWLELP